MFNYLLSQKFVGDEVKVTVHRDSKVSITSSTSRSSFLKLLLFFNYFIFVFFYYFVVLFFIYYTYRMGLLMFVVGHGFTGSNQC